MKQKTHYECHVTMEGDPKQLREAVERAGRHPWADWHFSAIDGDPDLGAGVKCYATASYGADWDVREVVAFLEEQAGILTDLGAKVVRTKVELVLYDRRTP